MTFVSYAQNDEDILLWRALKAVERGFYIDVGAGMVDGYSVSRAFYEHGWRGVNIEPVSGLAQELRAARPEDATLAIALGATEGERDFFTVPETGLSTLEPVIADSHRAAGRPVIAGRVAVRTLAGICREYASGPIHFLTVDVEGAEAEVLEGADFSLFRPWVIVIEAVQPLRPDASHAAWEPALIASDYRFVWFDGLNRFYVAGEREAALARYFRTPPNVWDAFVRFDRAHEMRLAAANAECRRLEGEVREQDLRYAADVAQASAEAFALRRAYWSEVEAKAALARRLAERETETESPAAAPVEAEPGRDLGRTPSGRAPFGRTRGGLRSMLKSVFRPCWRLARPVLRPLAWRTRGFLIGPVQGSLGELRAGQERLALEINAAREQLGKETADELQAVTAAVEAAVVSAAALRAEAPLDQVPGQTVGQASDQAPGRVS